MALRKRTLSTVAHSVYSCKHIAVSGAEELDRIAPIVGSDGPRVIWAHFQIGRTLEVLGRHDDALERYRLGMELLDKAHGPESELTTYNLHQRSIAHALIAGVLCPHLSRCEEAIPHARESLRLCRRKLTLQPDSARYMRDEASSLAQLGQMLLYVDGNRESEVYVNEAVMLSENLLAADPDNGAFRIDNLSILSICAESLETLASNESLEVARRIELLEDASRMWQRLRGRANEPWTLALRPVPTILQETDIEESLEKVRRTINELRNR